MVNSYSGGFYNNMPMNVMPMYSAPVYPMTDYNMPVNVGNIPVSTNPIAAGETTNTDSIKEKVMDSTYYQYQAIGSSEAAKVRERNELKNRISFLENQVRRYPDNITFAIQLDKAKARLRELDRR